MMKEILYIEVPTPDIDAVRSWLQYKWQPQIVTRITTSEGIRLQFTTQSDSELSIFVWTVQRTTYLKMFQWGEAAIKGLSQIKDSLVKDIRAAFPPTRQPAIVCRQSRPSRRVSLRGAPSALRACASRTGVVHAQGQVSLPSCARR